MKNSRPDNRIIRISFSAFGRSAGADNKGECHPVNHHGSLIKSPSLLAVKLFRIHAAGEETASDELTRSEVSDSKKGVGFREVQILSILLSRQKNLFIFCRPIQSDEESFCFSYSA